MILIFKNIFNDILRIHQKIWFIKVIFILIYSIIFYAYFLNLNVVFFLVSFKWVLILYFSILVSLIILVTCSLIIFLFFLSVLCLYKKYIYLSFGTHSFNWTIFGYIFDNFFLYTFLVLIFLNQINFVNMIVRYWIKSWLILT